MSESVTRSPIELFWTAKKDQLAQIEGRGGIMVFGICVRPETGVFLVNVFPKSQCL